MEPQLLFSTRLAIDIEFQNYCRENGVSYCIMNFMAFVSDRGWINQDEVKKSMSREKIDKLLKNY